MFHLYVPTGINVRVYNHHTHDLCSCVTDDINTKYPPLILRRNTTYKKNPICYRTSNIHECHPLYELIRCIFFFLDGGEGCHPARRNSNGGKISLMQYYKFLLNERSKKKNCITGNSILQGQKLMTEFVVIVYIREQEQKLSWMQQNQNTSEQKLIKLCAKM